MLGINQELGDFNILIVWTNQICFDKGEVEFMECILDPFLDQYVHERTGERAI